MVKSTLLLFSVLLLSSSIAFGQSKPEPMPEAYVYAEFGPSSATNIAAKITGFYRKLQKEKSSQGYVINYGGAKAIKKRRGLLMKGINFRMYDPPRVTFVDVVTKKSVKTIMWIVPEGAEEPTS